MTRLDWRVDWRAMLAVGGLVGLIGLGAGGMLLGTFAGAIASRVPPDVFLAVVGGAAGAAGAAMYPLFGRQGWTGWPLALAGALMATVVAAALAGAAMLHMVDYGLVVISLFFTLIWPFGPLWLAAMAGVHVLAKHLRRGGQAGGGAPI